MSFLRRSFALKFSKSILAPIVRSAIALLLVLFAIGAVNCQTSRSRITPIIEELRSPQIEVRDAASDKLSKLATEKLTPEESIEALEAAADSFQLPTAPKGDISEALILAVAENPRSEYAPVIRRLFGKYSPSARNGALILLGKLHDAESVATIVELIVATNGVTNLPATDTTTSDVDMTIESTMYGIVLDHIKAKRISDLQLQRLAPVMIAASHRYRSLVGKFQRADGTDWMWEESYADPRANAAYLLDILGYIRSPEAERELTNVLPYTDPLLKVFTVTSLLRHGIVSPVDQFDAVARNSFTRETLYSILQSLRRLDLFPKTYSTPAALAESNMVAWLVYPTELGQPPDSIQQMAIRSMKTPEGIEDYYFFRFRTNPPHWAADKGWLAGVAGPFLRADIPTLEGGSSTFSEFEPWTDSFPNEYMKANAGR